MVGLGATLDTLGCFEKASQGVQKPHVSSRGLKEQSVGLRSGYLRLRQGENTREF